MSDKLIDRYLLDEKIGEGGMGLVYKAWDPVLQRPVALKAMHPALAQDPVFLQRFRTEARAVAQLECPHIVAVHDLLETGEGFFIVMQYVKGISLAERIQREGPLPCATALAICRQILIALTHAHRAGVIHRDIKPGNVMLTEDGLVKVTDFGLAKLQQGSVLTLTQITAGTLYYMPPEQIRDFALADQRSDLYSVGMTMYEMLTARLPFDRTEDLFSLAKVLARAHFPPPRHFDAGIPPAVSELVMWALNKKPSRRPQSAHEMLEELERLEQRGSPATALQPPRRVLARLVPTLMLVTALVLLAVGLLLWNTSLGPRLLDWLGFVSYARLSLFTTPAGVSARLNGKFQGHTPLQHLVVKAGTNDLLLQKQGYAEIDTPVVLPPDHLTTLHFALTPLSSPTSDTPLPEPARPAFGGIDISAEPEGAAIFYKGKRLGSTRYRKSDFAAGTHQFRLRREGYHDSTITLLVEPDRTASARVALRPRLAMLSILVRPYGAIYVDGQLWAANTELEQSRSVQVGKHKVRLEHPIWGQQQHEITVRSDGPNEFVFDFKRE